MVIDARHRLATVKQLPYDAEIEYLESTGTQYIDTGIYAKSPMSGYAKFMLNPESIGNDVYVVGASSAATSSAANGRMYFGTYQSKWMFGYGIYAQNGIPIANTLYEASWNWVPSNVNAAISDGTTLQISDSSSKDIGGNLYAFGRHHVGESKKFLISAKIYNLKLFNGSIALRDFIPVRFTNELGQSEGAMYDKVSGQLFRNQGSGEFVMGPDVAPAPYVVTYRKPFVSFPNVTPTAKSYIQDGLIAMWDGIENAGWETHDSSAAMWADLSNNGNDLNITAGTWAANHFMCSGASGGKAGFITDIVTIEIVVKRVSTAKHQLVIGLNSSGGYYNRYFAISGGACNFASWGPPIPIATDITQSFSGVVGSAYYINGEAYTTSGRGDYYSSGSDTGISLGIAGTGNYPFGGEIYCIRLYSRPLTAAEVTYNYQIDKIRFNLL